MTKVQARLIKEALAAASASFAEAMGQLKYAQRLLDDEKASYRVSDRKGRIRLHKKIPGGDDTLR